MCNLAKKQFCLTKNNDNKKRKKEKKKKGLMQLNVNSKLGKVEKVDVLTTI